MIKDIITKNETAKPNDKEMALLHEHFPQCFDKEGHFDMEKFRSSLNGKIDFTSEGYDLNFLGKSYAKLLASLDTETVIQPDLEHNANPENAKSENVYISGDNLDALKHLLKSYSGMVKCIYIDPPYNTGSDGFVYNDKFTFTAEQLVERLSISDEEAEKILDLTNRNSASHSAWLTFMFPRLLLAKDLLAEDGVIFISIDDNEQANLKLLCDNVFGEENFIAQFIWKKRQQVDSRTKNGASSDQDYLLCYGRTSMCSIRGKKSDTDKYNNPDNDPRGKWMSDNMVGLATASQRPNLHYDLTNPATGITYTCPPTGWRYERKRMAELIANNEVLFPKEPTGRPRRKKFLKDVESQYTGLSTILNTVYSSQGTRELREIFEGRDYFDFPKPVDYIKLVIEQGILPRLEEEAIIVDFFGGSSTTAHAAMELMGKYPKLHYILVQLQEKYPIKSEAYQDGYHTIDQIGMERIRRAADKIRKESPLFHGDLGFKHYTLQEPSLNQLYAIEDFNPNEQIEGFGSSILESFGRDTVLTTWLIRDRQGFNAKVTEVQLADYTAYWCGHYLYLIDAGFSEDAAKALVEEYGHNMDFNPENVIVFGYSLGFSEMERLKYSLQVLRNTEKSLNFNLNVRY